MIQLEKINKYYPVGKDRFHALKNISLSIGEGEFVSIEGESGAGKSTLLHIIGLLDRQDDGSYLLDGEPAEKLKDDKASKLRNEKIGFIMQDFALIPGKTVLFNTMLPLLVGKKTGSLKTIRDKAKTALERVGIFDQTTKKVSQLSGGQKQRAAIARALITNPDLILADEPTGALDSQTSEQILQLLQSINQTEKITVIVVTHSAAVSAKCKRRIVMSDGEIISDSAEAQ